MNEDYLWDRSGPPDPEIERLEQTLAPLRYRHRTDLRMPAPKARRSKWAMAAAAAVVLGAVGVAEYARPDAPVTAWQLGGMNVKRGQVLRTGQSGMQLEADAVGRVDLGPNSELRATGEKRLELKRGELHAFIWAPAREFVVDTPSARAVDLGCQYTLNVDERGDGLLKVSMGWVAFEVGGREAFIPQGAQCRTRKRTGPGLPWFEDSSAAFQEGVAALDRGDAGALAAVLREARARDGLTLWHLLTRMSGQDRAAVYDRFAELVKLPEGVTKEGIMRQEPRMIDLCWDALGLENTSWWRGWERRWGG
jgi:FecR protein